MRSVGRSVLRRDRTDLVAILIAAAVIALLGTFLRQQGVPGFRTIWAEDGSVFVQCALDSNFVACLTTPYDAWINAITRTLAAVVAWFDPAAYSYLLTALAGVVLALSVVLVARAVADATRRPIDGLLAAVGVALVYPAGVEVGGNITNLHWILFAAAVTVTVATWLGHRFDVADAVLVLSFALSSPFSLVVVALAAVGAAVRRPHMAAVAVACGVVALIQVAVSTVSPRIEVPGAAPGSATVVSAYLDTVVRLGIFGRKGWIPDWLVTVALVAVLAGLTIRAARAGLSRAHRADGSSALAPLLDAAAPAAIVGSGIAVFALSWVLNHHVAARHIYAASALTVVALVVGLGCLMPAARTAGPSDRAEAPDRSGLLAWSPGVARIAHLGLAIVLAVGFAGSFRLVNAASRGPNVPTEIPPLRAACNAGSIAEDLTISPLPASSSDRVWTIHLPCSRLETGR